MMNISLTPQLEEIVQKKVQSGLYTSASEVLREALRVFLEKERADEENTRLKALIQAGFDSGKPVDLKSADELVAMAKKKYKR
jgi:antitoxin ParD1/3/4